MRYLEGCNVIEIRYLCC